MELTKLMDMGKPCDICGSVGWEECKVTCAQCKAREHVYCTRCNNVKIPDIWFCGECSPNNVRKGPRSKARAANKASCSSFLTAKPPRPLRRSGDKLNSSGVHKRPASYNLLHYEKYPSNRPNLEATWNGSFKILNMVSPGEIYYGFRAHLPRRVDRKVYKFSKQMPEVLQFKLLPRSDIWEEIFQSDFAYGYDISLYFFPGNFERSIEQYASLLEFIEKEDMVMRCCNKGVELLMFTSKRLHFAEELNWESFFWGVFRAVKDNHVAATPSSSDGLFEVNVQTSNPEMTILRHSAEVKNKRPNDLDVPPGFPRKTTHEVVFVKSSTDLIEVPISQLPVTVGCPITKALCDESAADEPTDGATDEHNPKDAAAAATPSRNSNTGPERASVANTEGTSTAMPDEAQSTSTVRAQEHNLQRVKRMRGAPYGFKDYDCD